MTRGRWTPHLHRMRGLLLILVLLGCGPGPPARSIGVVLISIDGLRPDAIFQADASNLLALSERGAYTWRAQTTEESWTVPAHAAMLSGQPTAVHGMRALEASEQRIAIPTIFSLAQAAGLRTVAVIGKEKLEQLFPEDAVDSFALVDHYDDDRIADAAIARAEAGFDLMFVHFPAVDIAGHRSGWMSPRYLAQVSETDRAVGRLIASLPADTVIIATSDHGGSGPDHFGPEPENRTIPWIASGPGIEAGHEITRPVHGTDTAATIIELLGLPLPAGLAGHAVLDAFPADSSR